MTAPATAATPSAPRWGRAVVFLVGLLALDRAVGAGIAAAGPRFAEDRRLADLAAGRLSADWWVIGSSRAARDVSAAALGEAVGGRAYNLGVPGSNVAFHREVAELIAERDGSVLWVVDDPAELSGAGLAFATDAWVVGLDDPRVRAILIEHDEMNPWFAAASWSYRYRRWTDVMLKASFKGQTGRSLAAVGPDGSMPLSGRSVTWDRIAPRPPAPYDRSVEAEELVEDFHGVLAALSGRRVVVVVPPNLDPVSPGFVDRIREVVGGRALVLDRSGSFPDKVDYYDQSHLGAAAAERFSRDLGRDLGGLLQLEIGPR